MPTSGIGESCPARPGPLTLYGRQKPNKRCQIALEKFLVEVGFIKGLAPTRCLDSGKYETSGAIKPSKERMQLTNRLNRKKMD